MIAHIYSVDDCMADSLSTPLLNPGIKELNHSQTPSVYGHTKPVFSQFTSE